MLGQVTFTQLHSVSNNFHKSFVMDEDDLQNQANQGMQIWEVNMEKYCSDVAPFLSIGANKL